MTQQAGTFGNFDKNKVQQIETLDSPVTKPTTGTIAPAKARAKTVERALPEQPKSVLDNIIAAGWLSWETVLWAIIIVLAIVTRVWDLGPRAMHHDESIHANFSYGLYKTNSIYKYDPVYHGPFLYYSVALADFLFGGASETAARIMPALYGIGIVILCYFTRTLIGKIGALALGVFVLISPSILYYSRSLRHDIFAVFGEFLLVIGVFRYMQSKPGTKGWWLFLAGLGLGVIYSSHELVFLNVAIIVSFLALVLAFEFVVLPKRVLNRAKAVPSDEVLADPAEFILQDEIDDELEEPSEPNSYRAIRLPEDAPPNRLQKVMTDRRLMSLIFMGLFGLTVLVGLLIVWQNFGATITLSGWVARLGFYVLLVPVAGIAFGTMVSAGFARLDRTPFLIGLIVSAVSFVGLAGYLVYRATRPEKAATTGATITAPGATPPIVETAVTKDFSGFGLQLPFFVIPVLFALILAPFIGMLVGWLWQRKLITYTQRGIWGAGIAFFTVMLSASLVSLRFTTLVPGKDGAPAALPKGNLLLAGPEVEKWLAYVVNGFLFALLFGALIGWIVSLAEVLDDDQLVGSAMLRGLLRVARRPWMVGAFLLGFALIYVPLFSNFFFYPEGLADGLYKGLEVWAGAHDVRRLDQPWFYYPWMMFLYETLATFICLIAYVAVPVQFLVRAIRKQRFVITFKGVFAGLALWWSALAMVVYSIAGEKAPWLNMQIALPASIAAAMFLDGFLRKIQWREVIEPGKGVMFAGLFVLLFAADCVIVGLLINLAPPDTNPNLRTQQVVESGIVAIIALMLLGTIYWLWKSDRVRGSLMRGIIGLLFGAIIVAYMVRSTIMLNYGHPDTAVEMMIYVQTTPEVPLFMQRLDRLARDVRDSYKIVPPAQGGTQNDPSNSRGLPVLVTQEVAWPLVWYLRDYTDVSYTTPSLDANTNTPAFATQDARGNNYAVIMLAEYENNSKVQDLLRDKYTAQTYKMRWWFPEDDSGYGGLGIVPDVSTNPSRDKKAIQNTDWGKWWQALSEQPYASRLWRYIIYRELWQPLQSYNMTVYVRNDLFPDFALTSATVSSNPAAVPSAAAGQPSNQTAFSLTESTQSGLKNGQYKTPRSIALAPNGDFLVMDSGNGRVQRFSADGTFISKFGTIGKGDGQFQLAQYDGGPGGIVTDEDGNIYVADSWNYRIQKFDKDGKLLLKWGEGFDTQGEPNLNTQNPYGLYGPRGLAYDKTAGELYVADTGNRRVMVYNKQGQFVRQFGVKGKGQGEFDEPVSVALSPDGKVYVSDLRNKRIQIFDKKGKYLSEIKIAQGWQEQPLSEPYLAFDSQGLLYVSDSPNARIYKYSPDGQFLQTIENQTGAAMVNPIGMVIAPDGFLYVADAKRNAIVKIKP